MLVIGSDHGGYTLKEHIKAYFEKEGIPFVDVGCDGESCDYPDIAKAAAAKITSGECEKGILCCGTGIGISIAANKVRGIRAALVSEPVSAALATEHNNANILCLGGRTIGPDMGVACIKAWMGASFLGDRHARRVGKIEG